MVWQKTNTVIKELLTNTFQYITFDEEEKEEKHEAEKKE